MARPEKWEDRFVAIAAAVCRLGATDEDLAGILGVSVRTVNYWKSSRPDFQAALKVGKEEADDRVQRALYHRAVGYEQDAVKIFMPAGAVEPVYAPYKERIAPDTTAAIFWLKNRRPTEWRDRSAVELSGPDGGAIQTTSIDATKISTDALREIMEAVNDKASETDAS